jgi:hypothetical protein
MVDQKQVANGHHHQQQTKAAAETAGLAPPQHNGERRMSAAAVFWSAGQQISLDSTDHVGNLGLKGEFTLGIFEGPKGRESSSRIVPTATSALNSCFGHCHGETGTWTPLQSLQMGSKPFGMVPNWRNVSL